MTREENTELETLSLECFGKKYEWRKLTRRGLVIGHDKESGHIRRVPLSPQQAKDYMVKTLEMRKKAQEENDADRG